MVRPWRSPDRPYLLDYSEHVQSTTVGLRSADSAILKRLVHAPSGCRNAESTLAIGQHLRVRKHLQPELVKFSRWAHPGHSPGTFIHQLTRSGSRSRIDNEP